jgi:hypothetical protein
MRFQPSARALMVRIDANLVPPTDFITKAMNFSVMSPAKRDRELVAKPYD